MKARSKRPALPATATRLPPFAALGLTLPPLAFGRPTATVKGSTESEEGMPARRVTVGHSPPSTIRRPSRLFNRVTFGVAHVFGVLLDDVFQYPDSSGVTK